MELTSLQNGRYQIERILGQGGFGITYRAVQTSLGRTVAIKEFFMKDYCERAEDSTRVTMGTQSSREMVQRYRDKFEKEARTLAKLKHPHIVPVIDVFRENNTSYYVMEYAEGASLKQRVDEEGPLSETKAVSYILQVADALRYLHGQHICHLDIKPANILTTARGEAILADFGLAKQYDEEGGETSTTPVGKSKGYAPPEQYRTGGVQSFSPETDVYALGATLYFLLTGKTPPESVLLNEVSLDVAPLSPNMAQAVQAAMQLRRADRVTLDVFEKLIRDEEKDETEVMTDIVEDDKVSVIQPERTRNSPHEKKNQKRNRTGLIKLYLVRGLVIGTIVANILYSIIPFVEISSVGIEKREIGMWLMGLPSIPLYIFSWIILFKSDRLGLVGLILASILLSIYTLENTPCDVWVTIVTLTNIGVCLILIPFRRYLSLYRIRMCLSNYSYKKNMFLKRRKKLRIIGSVIATLCLITLIIIGINFSLLF